MTCRIFIFVLDVLNSIISFIRRYEINYKIVNNLRMYNLHVEGTVD
jgi:hypothetical protein